jgi:hypothetical protein
MDRTFTLFGSSQDEEPTLEAEQAPAIPQAPKPTRLPEQTPVDEQRVRLMRDSLTLAQGQTPDQAAKVRELAIRLNLPTTVVERDYEGLSQRYADGMVPTYRIAQYSPALAGVLSNPETAAVVKDDVEQLGFLEWVLKRPARAFIQSTAQLEAATMRGREVFTGTPLTAEENALYDHWQNIAAWMGDDSADNTQARKLIAGGATFLSNQGEVFYQGGPLIAFGTMLGAAGGATVGSLSANPAGIYAGAMQGARIGSHLATLLAGAKFTALAEAGAAYDEYLGMTDDQGRTVDKVTARKAAMIAGTANAVVEIAGLEVLFKSIPGVKDWTKLGTRKAVKELLKQPSTRRALMALATNYFKVLGAEVSQEVAQRGVTLVAGETVKDVSREMGVANIPPMSPGEALGQLGGEAVGAAYAFGLGVAYGPAMQFHLDTQKAHRATEARVFLQGLTEGAAASKTVQRSPDLAMAFLREAAKDGPIQDVFIKKSTWDEYWRQRDVDPAEVALEVTGDAQAIAQAEETGFLRVPTERYAVKLGATAHNAFFLDEIRLRDPYEMNAREAAEWVKTDMPRIFDEILAAQQTSEAVPPTVTGQAGVAVPTSAATPAASSEATAPHPAAVLYQTTQGEQRWYYSPLTVAVTNWRQNQGTVDQVLAQLRTTKGAALEAEEMGLPQWLAERGENVTKQALRDFIAANAVTLEETVKGKEQASGLSDLQNELRDLDYEIWGEDDSDIPTLINITDQVTIQEGDDNWNSLPTRVQELYEQFRDLKAQPPKYASYTLKGGTNYRELLVRVPLAMRSVEPTAAVSVGRTMDSAAGPGVYVLRDANGWSLSGHQYSTREEAERKLEELRAQATTTEPDPDKAYTSGHWDEQNVIFHVRLKDRILADGRRVLFVEEVQSDLHQAGRKEGYLSDLKAKQREIEAKLKARRDELGKPGGKRIRAMQTDHLYQALESEYNKISAKMQRRDFAPDLPFKNDAWKKLAMRRLLALAAEGNYDALAWTTGEQQADRYSLQKQVDSVSYNPKSQTLYATEKDGGRIIEEVVAPENLEKYIGPELAEKLRAKVAEQADVTSSRGVWTTKWNERKGGWNLVDPYGNVVKLHPMLERGVLNFETEEAAYRYADKMIVEGRIESLPTLSNIELKVGGEGMKAFYDQILVNLANTLGKPFGVRSEIGDVIRRYEVKHNEYGGGWRLYADGDHVASYDTEAEANAAQERFEKGGPVAGYRVNSTVAGKWAVYDSDFNVVAGPFNAEDRAIEELLHLQGQGEGNRSPAHVLPTPPAMRDELLAKGQPLYQVKEGEAQEAAAQPAATEELPFTVEDLMRSLGLTRTQAQYTFAVANAMGLDLSHLALARGGRPDPDALFSVREWKAGDKKWARDFVALSAKYGWDAATANGAVDLIDGVIAIFEAHKTIFPQEGDPKSEGAIYANADFKYTFDVNRTCMRVKKYWTTVKAVEAKVGHPLNEFEMLRLGQMMRQDGDLPGCIYCYVESGRRANQRNAVRFIQAKATDVDLTDAVRARIVRRDELLKALGMTAKKFARYVTREDFDIDAEIAAGSSWTLTEKGTVLAGPFTDKEQADKALAQARKGLNKKKRKARKLTITQTPLAELLGHYKAGKGAGRGGHSIYGHTILRMPQDDVDETNARAGLRWQSSTDLDPTQIAERLKGYADSSVRGLRGHEYAKEPFAVLIFGDTGIKQNLSVALNWTGTDFVSDDVNGMPLSWALWLRENFANAGTMLTAKNLEQIKWALDSPLIDMIIPHHAASWSEHGFTTFDLDDFAVQTGARVHEVWINEKIAPTWQAGETIPQGKKVGAVKTPVEFYEGGELWITSYLNRHPGNEQAAVDEYLAFCASHNMHPKWSGGTYYDRHTKSTQALDDFTQHPNYIKLLRDYARTDSPQEALDITRVNREAMKQFLDLFIANNGFADREVARENTVDRFVDLLKSGKPLGISAAEKRLLRSRKQVGEVSVVGKALLPSDVAPSLSTRLLPLTVLDQLSVGVPQASVEFLKDARALIRGFSAADASSGVHELAHVARRWLFSRNVPAENRQGITDEDIEIAEAECGVVNGEWTVDAEERFARMFERYLRDGQSPSERLADLFTKMAAFLLEVYKTVTGTAIDVTVSPAMRGVFDHLMTRGERLAELTRQTDQAAVAAQAQVQPMILTPEAAGMTPEAFALYRQQIEDASKQQREALRQRALEQVARESRAEWRKRKAEVTTQVTEEFAGLPVYRAVAAIRQGTTPLGEPLLEGQEPEPMRLDRAAIVAEFGEARLSRIPRGLATTEGGIDPRLVAQQFGFPSVDAMLTALETTTPFSKAIRDEVNRRMVAENGTLLEPAALADRAREMLANDSMESVRRAELRAMRKLQRTVQPFLEAAEDTLTQEQRERDYERQWLEAEAKLRIAIAEGRKQIEIDALRDKLAGYSGFVGKMEGALPRAGDIRAMARARLGSVVISRLSPQAYWNASRSAAAEAATAFAKQDIVGATRAKVRELTTIALYREALKARDEIEKRLRKVDALASPAGQARLGLAGASYQDAVNTVLDQYGFAAISQKALKRLVNLREWMQRQEEQDIPVDLPSELVDQAQRIQYQELTLEQFRAVTDGLEQIAHLARLKNKLLKIQAGRELDELADTLRTRAIDSLGIKKLPVEPGRRAESRKRSVAEWFSMHARVATLAYALDGHAEGGVWWQTFVKPLNDAAVWERGRKVAEGKRLWDIVTAHYSPAEIARWSSTRFIPAIGEELTNEARIAVALNWGNQGNRDRLLADPRRQWKLAQIEAILDTLEERDWQFVQAIWDFNESFRDEIAAKQRRVTGVEPTWVDAVPVETKWGTFRGGYYHLAYDGDLSPKSAQQEQQTTAKLNTAAAYVSSTTKRGQLKERVKNVKQPVKLSLSVEFQHLDDVLHDLAYHEVLIDLNRVLRRMGDTLYDVAGNRTLYREFEDALRSSASGLARPTNGVERFFQVTRTGTQLALLGANVWTAVQQITGIFNGMADVGPGWVTQAILHWSGTPRHMIDTRRWIDSVSPFMADRVKNATMEIADVRDRLSEPGGWFDNAVRRATGGKVTALTMADAMMWHIQMMQAVADTAVWLAAHEKAMATAPAELALEKKEARAVALADQSVRDTQGTFDVHDLARVERGGPIQRAFTVFYHYGNTVLNTTAKVTGRTNFRSPKSMALMLRDLSLLYVAPAAATVMLAHALGKRVGDDDDPWWTLLAEIGVESLSAAFNTMVLLRELGSAATMAIDPTRTGGVRGYEGPAGLRFMASLYKLTYKAGEGDFDADFWKTANQLGGIYFHYPALQIQRTVEGAIALMQQRTRNPAAVLVGPPPKQ